MIFPKFLTENDSIGIVALSSGVGHKIQSFEQTLSRLKKEGYRIIEDKNVRLDNLRGGTALERASGLKRLFEDDDVGMILCAAGGDFMYEVLPHIDLESIKRNPKWFMGASDPTSLAFMITTKLDIASFYGYNAGSFDIDLRSIDECLLYLKGDLIKQESFDLFENTEGFLKDELLLTDKVYWETYGKKISETGRCIGGCIDVLKDVMGTPFHDIHAFNKNYADDGIIWYFDVFSMSAESLYITLLQMKAGGWFENVKAFIFGRVVFPNSFMDLSYKDAIEMALKGHDIVMDADIGHTTPRMTMINGAMMTLEAENGKGSIAFTI